MQLNWTLTALISAAIGGIIAYFLTDSFTIAIIITVAIFVAFLVFNPKTRYMKAFYTVLFPLLSNLYFELQLKNESLDLRAGIEEMDWMTTIVLGGIAAICLILDYLERNGKLNALSFESNKNKVGNISGNNISINQNIQKDKTNDQ